MKAKDARNMIIALIVVAIGIKLITWISGRYISGTNFSGVEDIVKAMGGLGDLALYGIAVIVILLIPYYFSKRSQEKKSGVRGY